MIREGCNDVREVGNFRRELLDRADDDGDELGVGETQGVVGVVADGHGFWQDWLHFLRDEAEVRALLGVGFPHVRDGPQLHDLVEAVGRARDVVLHRTSEVWITLFAAYTADARGRVELPSVKIVLPDWRHHTPTWERCGGRGGADTDFAVLVDDQGGGGGKADVDVEIVKRGTDPAAEAACDRELCPG